MTAHSWWSQVPPGWWTLPVMFVGVLVIGALADLDERRRERRRAERERDLEPQETKDLDR